MTRDCHGDLHLDHVYFFPEQQPPADLLIIDCIEFNERLRFKVSAAFERIPGNSQEVDVRAKDYRLPTMCPPRLSP
jgi:hypothetical protein